MKRIRHAISMVRKNYKSYLLLSVTALLSFLTMFLYLIYNDSNIYNKYRYVMGSDSEVLLSHNSAEGNEEKIKILTEQLDKIKDTHYYIISNTFAEKLNMGGQSCDVNILPNYTWALFDYFQDDRYAMPQRLTVNGQKEIMLKESEAIVSKPLYDFLEKEYGDKKSISLMFTDKKGNEYLRRYSVVGKYELEDDNYSDPVENNMADAIYISDSYVLQNSQMINTIVVIKSSEIGKISGLVKDLGLTAINSLEDKNQAISENNILIKNKYLIAMVLFVLLGINLYSSFVNALNDRKFEIGVKRAVGANKFHILFQFLVEGLIVMLMNIILAVMIGIMVMVFYKYLRFIRDGYAFVVTMTRQSAELYALFTISLSVLFSLIFAYRSTCVEIIKYLKEEL